MEKISEAQIEKKVTEHAKRAGWLSYKWVSPSQRWVPDRLYFKNGQVKMIEFKTPGNTISSFLKTGRFIPWREKTGYTEENQVSLEKATKK